MQYLGNFCVRNIDNYCLLVYKILPLKAILNSIFCCFCKILNAGGGFLPLGTAGKKFERLCKFVIENQLFVNFSYLQALTSMATQFRVVVAITLTQIHVRDRLLMAQDKC
jgi:hypothetical protein